MGRKLDPKPRRVTITRYQTPDGKRATRATPGAIKVRTTSDTYYVSLPDPVTRKPVYHSLGTGELVLAWSRLRDLLQTRKEAELGILDDRSRQAGRAILDHAQEWLASVAAGGATAKRVELMRSRIGKLVGLAGWVRITDLRKSSCQAALARLQADGASAQTRNHYLSHVRQFARWLVSEQRLAADPLAGLVGVSVESDRRHDRRCPGDEEIALLFEHLAADAPIRKGMTGECRALAYQVAMCSGLRANELRSLTWERFDLETGQIHLQARKAKNRKRTAQPLPVWLCARLRVYRDQAGQLWQGFPGENVSKKILGRNPLPVKHFDSASPKFTTMLY